MDTPTPISLPFGTGSLPVEILFVMTAHGGWHVEAVYFRVQGGKVQQHPHWPEGFGGALEDDPLATWNYLSERYLEDNGGNGMTWDIGGFEVASVSDIAVVVGAAEAELIASPTGPLIAGGTIAATANGVLDAMPAVVEYADGPILRATGTPGTDHDLTVHRADNGLLLTPIGSEDLLAPQVRWPLEPDVVYRVRTPSRVWTLVVTAEGSIATLAPGEAAIDPSDEEVMDEETVPVGPALRIDRQSAPAWVYQVDDDDMEWADHCLGGQKEWCWAVPWVFQVLAAPRAYGRMPVWPPRPREADHVPGAGYWNALLYMLTYSFGWSRPDKGLDWWVQEGKPQEDLRLRLLAQVWDRDGHLDWFLAWLVGSPPGQDSPLAPSCVQFDDQPLPVDDAWVRRQAQDHEPNLWVHPQGLHLGGHHWTALEDPPHGSRMTVVSVIHRRATFVAPSMRGWYGALMDARQYLPQADTRDWKVDVIVRPVGWLGTYRRSWSTGLWFAGKHRFHAVGN